MLAEMTTGLIVQIAAIGVPLIVGATAFFMRSQEKQNDKIALTCTDVTRVETKVCNHEERLDRGDNKFESLATQIGEIKEKTASVSAHIDGVRKTQSAMDTKLDELLARG